MDLQHKVRILLFLVAVGKSTFQHNISKKIYLSAVVHNWYDWYSKIITQLLQPQEQDFPFKNKLHCNVCSRHAEGTSVGKHRFQYRFVKYFLKA